MDQCWDKNKSCHLLNSVFCVGPTGTFRIRFRSSKHIVFLLDGAWSAWGSWSSCNPMTGKKQRTRQCNNPASPNERAECSGSNKDETTCKGKPVNNSFLKVHIQKIQNKVFEFEKI